MDVDMNINRNISEKNTAAVNTRKPNQSHVDLNQRFEMFGKYQEVGQGLVLWKPNGAMVRYLLERFSQEAHILNGYQWVYTPHIGKAGLWETSGHLDFYRESMYSPIEIDQEAYFLKPMSCPFHVMIYNDGIKSYKDLPVRYAEYATVYRYELSGALNGLTRVRGFTQDDAHIICTPEQIQKEVQRALQFSLYILQKFNLSEFKAYISTRNASKFIGDPKEWEQAEASLKEAAVLSGLDYEVDEGGGAFYGPKIDLKLTDSSGREWQCSTIQFDFNLPLRFGMSYIGSDGRKHTPMMVHRALFGSIERFTAMLMEHYGGDFPFWLSPVQVRIVPVAPAHHDYAEQLALVLKKKGIRLELDLSEEKLGARIRDAELHRSPYILVAGDREVKSGSVTVRERNQQGQSTWDFETFVKIVEQRQKECIPEYLT